MAPSFAPDALELLQTKKNLRILKVDMTRDDKVRSQYVSMNGGMLVQDRDSSIVPVSAGQCVTEAKPTEAQLADLDFAWKIVKHVKSNAIVVAKDGMTYGVGAGQMNRVGSAEIGAPAKPVVAKGDVVKVGTLLAEAGGFVSSR